ncbi:MAG TPA: superoxide dismutase [Candidatus Limnocylindria bacterium]|nr:superoxide dismutase [Candidatus Limnocylindria bacterium]
MYSLPSLPYAYGALEPYIDAQTMEIHHTKHHQAYIDNLNKALASYPEWQNKPVEQLLLHLSQLPEAIQTAVRNNGGGHFNHSLFWKMMKPHAGGTPQGPVGQEITKVFGSFAAAQEQFTTAAKTVFGSGWAWLCVDKDGKLVIRTTPNQDNPIAQGLQPILGLDVWEHAYYLKYQNRRPDYITAWWHVINWEDVEENYRKVIG